MGTEESRKDLLEGSREYQDQEVDKEIGDQKVDRKIERRQGNNSSSASSKVLHFQSVSSISLWSIIFGL